MKAPILICHSNIGSDAPADELDVLEQVEWFRTGLEYLGLDYIISPFNLNMDALNPAASDKPGLIVNLVETIDGDGRMIHIAPSFFEHYKIPFTGCSSESIYATSNKILAKKIMTASGIPTPPWLEAKDDIKQQRNVKCKNYIIKSLWEHASAGIDEHNLNLPGDNKKIIEELKARNMVEGEYFAEQYIHGREFNLSVIETSKGPRVLPPAEIRFNNYPDGKPMVVGYRAKWDKDSFEYQNTVRSFERLDRDGKLHILLENISLRLWDIFRLNGYARVDFRVDEKGVPWVLEINANPCISGDSGFVAAAEKAGMKHFEIVENLITSTRAYAHKHKYKVQE